MLQLPATVFVVALIAYAFVKDRRLTRDLSGWLWVPTMWLGIVSSRPVSQWLDIGVHQLTPDVIEAGSPVDRFVFTTLLILGGWGLMKRNVKWSNLAVNNWPFFALYLFAAASALWSPYPFVSIRRWLRGLGALFAALLVATERDPFHATLTLLRRVAFISIPLSVLFIKYYRELGVTFGYWGGTYLVGVTNNKNTLGRLCLLAILYFTFELIVRRWSDRMLNGLPLLLSMGYLGMASWLLAKADSATSLGTTLVGVVLLVGGTAICRSRLRLRILAYIGIAFFAAFGLSTQVVSSVADIFQRDSTLTGRTELWDDLLEMRGSSLVGTGYGGFWIGERLERLWAQSKYWWLPTSAHNGYLEAYLELGVVGLFLLLACVLAGYRRIREFIPYNSSMASFHLALFSVFVVYNLTESATSLNSMMWFIFLLIAIRPALPLTRPEPVQARRDASASFGESAAFGRAHVTRLTITRH